MCFVLMVQINVNVGRVKIYYSEGEKKYIMKTQKTVLNSKRVFIKLFFSFFLSFSFFSWDSNSKERIIINSLKHVNTLLLFSSLLFLVNYYRIFFPPLTLLLSSVIYFPHSFFCVLILLLLLHSFPVFSINLFIYLSIYFSFFLAFPHR